MSVLDSPIVLAIERLDTNYVIKIRFCGTCTLVIAV